MEYTKDLAPYMALGLLKALHRAPSELPKWAHKMADQIIATSESDNIVTGAIDALALQEIRNHVIDS